MGPWLVDIESFEQVSQDETSRKLVLRMAQLSREGRLLPFVTRVADDPDFARRIRREVRANLAHLRQAGATVDYARADVRDLGTLTGILDGWRRRYGEPVGLIHGVGLIRDKLIREKTPHGHAHIVGLSLGVLVALGLLRDVPDVIDHLLVSGCGTAARLGPLIATASLIGKSLLSLLKPAPLLSLALRQSKIPQPYVCPARRPAPSQTRGDSPFCR